ncbi:MAG: NAAT family transporter [Rhabdochlamydiaceae bacterium]|nr:NAAT family transporter [Rhabdochlamydiaceae bacterium]
MDLQQMIKLYIGIFMICSPCSAIPAFLSLTEGRSIAQRKRVSIIASIAVAVILLAMAWFGGSIMDFFGIRLATFQVAGGIILFLLALAMLYGDTRKIKCSPEDLEEAQKESVEIVPLAIPLMAGPGAISSVILAAGNNPGIVDHIYLSICLLAVAGTLYLCLYFASFLEKKLGKTGLKVFNRIGGLIISVIAVDVFSRGIGELFPGLL